MMRFDALNTIAAFNAAAASASATDKIGNKRVYYCQRCLNHNRLEPRKNHKCDCAYANCTCNKCILVEKRRVLNTQLHELEEVVEGEMQVDSEEQYTPGGARIKGERVPNCQKCGQHGRKSRLKGHKRVCPFRDCNCAKCQVVSERQKLMADQIKIRRRQRKDTLMNITRDNITATLNAAAVVAASGPLPYLSNFNVLLYKQLQQNMQTAPSFMNSPSPTDSISESISYSPPNSLNCFAPPSPDAFKMTQNSVAASTPTNLSQLPLLFQNPAASAASAMAAIPSSGGVSSLLDTLAASVTSHIAVAPPRSTPIAMPVAINPLLNAAACSSSAAAAMQSNAALAAAATSLPTVSDNEQLFQSLLANVRLLEQMRAMEKQQHSGGPSSAFVDVCSM